jgi:short-subunit dehydrogenase
MPLTFSERYGPWALVTGAASGLGKEFTNQLAASKLNIIAIDIQADKLQEQVLFLKDHYHVDAHGLMIDLSEPNFLHAVITATEGLEVGLVANVAGLSYVKNLLDLPLESLQRQVAINCQAPLALAYHFGRQMRERRRGGIVFTSSASAYQGTALVANYAATKAYNLVLAEGLWNELQEAGVDVLGFAPGATNTPGFHSGTPQYKTASVPYMEPGPTVAEALAALGKSPSRIAGKTNRMSFFLLSRLMSRTQAIKLVSASMHKLYPHIKQELPE